MEIDEQVKDIKIALRLSMNGPVSQSMREKGYTYKLNFGVELPRIKEIAATYGKNYSLAQALWKEDIRECKILAGLLMPAELFLADIAEIWIEQIENIEIAELTVMNLFQYLSYAPAISLKWIANNVEFTQVCGFLTISRLLSKKGDMDNRSSNEFIDQAICAVITGSYNVCNAARTALRKYMLHSEENAFKLCRYIENFAHSTNEKEQMLYSVVSDILKQR